MRNILLKVLFVAIIILIILFVTLFNSHKTITQNISTVPKTPATLILRKGGHMTITSSAFEKNSIIPTKYTCDGQSINPPLSFEEVPMDTKSLVMLMDDPDVPKNLKPDGVFDHWVVYNIDPHILGFKEDSKPSGTEGLNGSGKQGYTPPCPPDREHRYFFKLFALDSALKFDDPTKVTKQMVIDKMQGHIIEQAELIGLYNRPQNK